MFLGMSHAAGLLRIHQLFHQMLEPYQSRLLRMPLVCQTLRVYAGLTNSFISAFNQINAGCCACCFGMPDAAVIQD